MLIADSIGDGSQQTALGGDDLLAGIEQHEASGSVGVLGRPGIEAGLAEESCLLIAENAADWNPLQFADALGDPSRRGHDLREKGGRDTHGLTDVIAPLQGTQIHQHRPRGVGDVGDVTTSG